MKRILLIVLAQAMTFASWAQLNTGDIAFVGFFADGTDNFAIVNLAEIPANSDTIYFSDKGWSGGPTFTQANEGNFKWFPGANAIPAGTIITFNGADATGGVTASIGIATGKSGLGAGGENLFCYYGTNVTTPTRFLGGFATNSSAWGSLANTGLAEGTNVVVLSPADADAASYKGPRTGSKSEIYANLNTMSNWDLQDGSGDQQNDGTTPDLPFATKGFTIQTGDNVAPKVSSIKVLSNTKFEISFDESVTKASAENISHYTFSPVLTISSIAYDEATFKAFITTAPVNSAIGYSLVVTNITDDAGNTMTTSGSISNLYYNDYTGSDLVFSEIMYKPGSDADTLDFIEIFNKGTNSIKLGGLSFKSGVIFTFPEYDLAANKAVLVAFDSLRAHKFYGVKFLQWSADELKNGGEQLMLINSLGKTLDSVNYDNAAPWPLEPDGNGASLELLSLAADNSFASSWKASTTATGKTFGTNAVFASPGIFSPVAFPALSFSAAYQNKTEGDVSVAITINASVVPTVDAKVLLKLLPVGQADSTADFTYSSQIITLAANGGKSITVLIPIKEDSISEADEMIGFSLTNPVNATVSSTSKYHTVYIKDNDSPAPVATKEIELNFVSRYSVVNPGTSVGLAEIVAYDPQTRRLVTMSTGLKKFDIIDFSNPSNPVNYKQIDVSADGSGITSVAISNGMLAVSVPAITSEQDNGSVLFYDMEGVLKAKVTAGALPDMITFTPDGKWLLAANEGQPKSDYTVDPEGTVTMIDVSGGFGGIEQSKVYTIDFKSFNAQEANLLAQGVRKGVKPTMNITLAQDLEPEYITVSADSKKAWVSLQENNAIAEIDLETKTATSIRALGLKDWSLKQNATDISDKNTGAVLANWPIRSFYMPDGIANYSIDGTTYIVTANEGDEREYDGLNERSRVNQITLDAAKFPFADFLRQDHCMGRLRISNIQGDTDGDGDFDELYVNGSRSFSIWNASTGELVYESANDFEKITSTDPQTASIFNANHEDNTLKGRSLAKGPEPEGVALTTINGEVYAFVTLERVGGVMAYNISDPENVKFVDYKNSRTTSTYGGDNGPEGIIVISGKESPDGKTYVISANEISGTLAIFELLNVSAEVISATAESNANPELQMYPNPVKNGLLKFTTSVSGEIFNVNGKLLKSFTTANSVDVSDMEKGIYIVKTNEGIAKKLMVE